MSFVLLGPCPNGCLKICIDVTSSGQIRLESCICPDHFQRKGGILHRQVKSVLTFVESRVYSMCSSINEVQLNHPSQIGPFLQEIEWQLGRIEEAAVELAMIRRRYKAMRLPLNQDLSLLSVLVIRSRCEQPSMLPIFLSFHLLICFWIQWIQRLIWKSLKSFCSRPLNLDSDRLLEFVGSFLLSSSKDLMCFKKATHMMFQ